MAGYATRVDVTLQADGGVRVVDNGRGIPVDMHPMEKKPAVEVVHDHPARRRQVRQRFLRGLRRPARRRRLGGQRAVQRARRRDPPRRAGLAPALRALRARAAAQGRGDQARGTTVTFWADRTIFETTTYNIETIRRRLQEMAFLNKGLTITCATSATAPTATPRSPTPRATSRRSRSTRSATRAASRTSSRTSTSQGPDPQEAGVLLGRGGRARGRGRDAVELRLHRVGLHLRQHHQHPRGRHPRRGLPRRADDARSTGTRATRSCSRRRTRRSPATTSARAWPRSSRSR